MTGTPVPHPAQASLRPADGAAIELHLPSIIGWERVAMEAAAAAARLVGLKGDRVEDIKTAVSEATLNAIEHGNAFDSRCMVIVALLPRSDGLEVHVEDQGGKSFCLPGKLEPVLLQERVEGAFEPRGRGLFLICSLMDQVDIVPGPRGPVLRMVALRQV